MLAFIRDVLRLDKLRRDSERLHGILAFAQSQNSRINDDWNEGRDARPPYGSDWNDLIAEIQPYEVD